MSKKLQYFGSSASFQNLYSDNLDGFNECILYGDDNAFSIAGGATFSALIKKTSGTSGWLFSKAMATGTAFEYSMFIFGSQLYCRIYSQGNGTIWQGRRTTTNISDGAWIRVTWATDALTAAGNDLYIDAVKSDTTNVNTGTFVSVSNTVAPLRLGAANDALQNPYNGRVAHPVMFNKKITGVENTELVTKKMGDYRTLSFAANIVFCNRFPNGTSDYPSYEDYSGNGHTGTMTNQENTDINTDIPT